MEDFRRFLRTLEIAQLHALWVMEQERLKLDQKILIRQEAMKRMRYATPDELKTMEGNWLFDITDKISEDRDDGALEDFED